MNFPGYDKKIIKDFNVEGMENVDSEDFEAGFGCVVKEKERVLFVHTAAPITKEQEEQLRWHFMTEQERERIEDEHLKRHGI